MESDKWISSTWFFKQVVAWVLSIFTASLMTDDHFARFSRKSFGKKNSSRFLRWRKFVASANKIQLGSSQEPGRSLMYTKDSRRPRKEPRGTPTSAYKKSKSSMFTWRCSFKHDSNYFKQCPLLPNFSSLADKIHDWWNQMPYAKEALYV